MHSRQSCLKATLAACLVFTPAVAPLFAQNAANAIAPASELAPTIDATHLRDLLRDLRHREESVRLRAIEALAGAANDLSPDIERELESGVPSRMRAILELVRRRPEYATSASLARCLATDDEALAATAERVLRALNGAQLSGVHDAIAALEGAVQPLAARRFRYSACYVLGRGLLSIAAAPGFFEGQYDDLLSQGAWLVTALRDIAVLAGDIDDPVQEAVSELARVSGNMRDVDYGFLWALQHADHMKRAIAAAREGINGARSSRELEGMRFAYTLLRRLRVRALQALGASRDPSAIEALYAVHTSMTAEPSGVFIINADELTLREETELSLARQGRRELLDQRLMALRMGLAHEAIREQDAGQSGEQVTPVAAPAELSDAPAQPETLEKLAFLQLRSGKLAEAIADYRKLLASLREDRSRFERQITRVSYNLACALSMTGDIAGALEHLKEAVACGYGTYWHFSWMLEDGDLKTLRGSAEFKRWFTESAPPYLAAKFAKAAGDGEAAQTLKE